MQKEINEGAAGVSSKGQCLMMQTAPSVFLGGAHLPDFDERTVLVSVNWFCP